MGDFMMLGLKYTLKAKKPSRIRKSLMPTANPQSIKVVYRISWEMYTMCIKIYNIYLQGVYK